MEAKAQVLESAVASAAAAAKGLLVKNRHRSSGDNLPACTRGCSHILQRRPKLDNSDSDRSTTLASAAVAAPESSELESSVPELSAPEWVSRRKAYCHSGPRCSHRRKQHNLMVTRCTSLCCHRRNCKSRRSCSTLSRLASGVLELEVEEWYRLWESGTPASGPAQPSRR